MTTPMPAKHASGRPPIVIVGAGLAGAATAYHLGLRGRSDVVLLEKERVPGVHSSGRNAAMIRQTMDLPELQGLADASVACLQAGRLADYQRCGGLLLGDGDEAAARWIPGAAGRGRFVPSDGVIDVAGLLQAYLRARDVRYDCELRSFEATEDGWQLETTLGPLRAGVLVNAAGPWAGALGGLPLTPLNRHLFTSAPDARIDARRPWLWDGPHGYYLRPESGGLLLSACDEAPAAPGDYEHDPAVLLDLLQKLARHQPGLGEPRIVHHWVGQRTFAPDRLPVLGFDVRRPHLFHVAGLGGHGVTLSHAVGELAAGMLVGDTPRDAAFDPERLAGVPGRP